LSLSNVFLTNSKADEAATKLGSASAIELARNVYAGFCALVEKRWGEIADFAETHAYWTQPAPGDDINLIRRRTALATLFTCSADTLTGFAEDSAWLKIMKRLSVLLDLLESQGCFILRRGTIENYFKQPGTGVDKPTAAAEEVSTFTTAASKEVEARYADILRCLRHAAATEPIVEAESVQDSLLSVATPVFARMRRGESTDVISNLASSEGSFFKFEVKDSSLVVSMTSQILSLPGFPLTIRSDEDVVTAIGVGLGLMKK
jgi:hypothetical protein